MKQPPIDDDRPARVLVIDDDRTSQMLTRNLRQVGDEVEAASDGAAGLALLRERDFELVSTVGVGTKFTLSLPR